MKHLAQIIIALCSFLTFGQQQIVDSLNLELQKHAAPTKQRLNILNDLVYYNSDLNSEKALMLADEAIQLAKDLHSEEGLAIALKNKGVAYHGAAQDSLALLAYQKSLDLQRKNHNQKGVASTQYNMGIIYSSMGDYIRTHHYYTLAYDVFKKETDSFRMAIVLNGLGINYMSRGHYKEAVDTYLQALRIYDGLGAVHTYNYANVYANLGILHKNLGNYDLAMGYQQEVLDLYKLTDYALGEANAYNSLGNIYDSMDQPQQALDYYEKSYQIMSDLKHQAGMASALTNMGIALTSLEDYDKSLTYLLETQRMYESLDSAHNLALVHAAIADNWLSKYYSSQSTSYLRKAQGELHEAYHYAEGIHNIDLEIDILNEMATVEQLLFNYKEAFLVTARVQVLKDSFLISEKKADIAKLEAEFDYQRKETALKNQHDIQQATSHANLLRQKLFRNMSLGGILLVLVLGGTGFYFFHKKNQATTQALISETELKALRAQMNPHFIFNSLNSISDYVLKNDKEEAINYLGKFSKLMRQTLEHSEKPLIPISEDLQALANYMDIERNRFQDRFSYDIEVDPEIDVDNTLVPPLILQPFIENSLVHGFHHLEKNGLIKIEIKKEANHLNCTVFDNGQGIHQNFKSSSSHKTSLGTKITKNRIEILNQQHHIQSNFEITFLKEGTLVTINLPFILNF